MVGYKKWEQNKAFDIYECTARAADNVLELSGIHWLTVANDAVEDDGRRCEVQPLRERWRGHRDFKNAIPKKLLKLFAERCWESAVMDSHTQAKAFEYRMPFTQPFAPDGQGGR